ncbi:AAA-like domain protein [Pirellulimonas nuda]|uniref:AAA-like domain protein n=1 Tax=Pirellulimonas nuda TaxID=2528009 RepID=A0A518D5Y9_9BACT|nr:DUF87 domain-containing protein [Pirellulimonas nuda]QDU86886.1 AAA-like domain protein [Pirellulimonas nuda]
MPNLDDRNSFYLGRDHDLATGQTSATPLLYDSKHLTTHAVCVGMTGSGKTGLCVSLLEEAALDGIPAIVIDPKGDLGNLLLAFPKLRPEDFRPWIDPGEAARKGVDPDAFAQQTADLWRDGLAKWDQGPERVQRYVDSVERIIFTPGSSAGVPLTVLRSFNAPPQELIDDVDLYRARVGSAASGLLALLGIDADPVRSSEHIFLSNVFDHAWRAGRDLGIEQLIREIQQPPFDKVGVMELESFFPAKQRAELAMALNNLLASPAFAGWMQGAPLSVPNLLRSPEGKPRVSILSIADLDDAQRMFFVTILLNEVLAWMRTQPGTGSLRAILYMDEVFGYFPPVGAPPSKLPMLTLLKQARAFGLGVVLATQNPVDLDYKGLSNCGTWLLGRLQTERDKARVMEGLEGASAQAGAQFNKQEMERTLAGLGSRVFLINNVHEDAPRVFHTRWAMSYLRGPLSREQVKTLMDPVRDTLAPPVVSSVEAPLPDGRGSRRPIVPHGVTERFVRYEEKLPRDAQLTYQPALYAHAKAHFVRTTGEDIDVWRDLYWTAPLADEAAAGVWSQAQRRDDALTLAETPTLELPFEEFPSGLVSEKAFKQHGRDLEEMIYQSERLRLWECAALGERSGLDEEEAAFRQRLEGACDRKLKAEMDAIETAFAAKIKRADASVASKQKKYDEQNSQFWGRLFGFVWKLIDLALSAIQGRAVSRRSSSSATAARQAATERGQAQRAKADLDEATAARAALDEQLDAAKVEAALKYDPQRLVLEPIEIAPRKSDIDVESLVLVWLPAER